MDSRRLSTGDVLALGITEKPAPRFGEPEDRGRCGWDVDGGTRDELAERIEARFVVSCSEYYGIPIGWKQDDGSFRGVLLQYRNVTEDHTFTTLDELLDWFTETAYSVAG